MSKIKQNNHQFLLQVYQEFTYNYMVSNDDFMQMIRYHLEGRIQQLYNLMHLYEIVNQNKDSLDRFQSILKSISQDLNPHQYFIKISIIKKHLKIKDDHQHVLTTLRQYDGEKYQLQYYFSTKLQFQPDNKSISQVQQIEQNDKIYYGQPVQEIDQTNEKQMMEQKKQRNTRTPIYEQDEDTNLNAKYNYQKAQFKPQILESEQNIQGFTISLFTELRNIYQQRQMKLLFVLITQKRFQNYVTNKYASKIQERYFKKLIIQNRQYNVIGITVPFKQIHYFKLSYSNIIGMTKNSNASQFAQVYNKDNIIIKKDRNIPYLSNKQKKLLFWLIIDLVHISNTFDQINRIAIIQFMAQQYHKLTPFNIQQQFTMLNDLWGQNRKPSLSFYFILFFYSIFWEQSDIVFIKLKLQNFVCKQPIDSILKIINISKHKNLQKFINFAQRILFYNSLQQQENNMNANQWLQFRFMELISRDHQNLFNIVYCIAYNYPKFYIRYQNLINPIVISTPVIDHIQTFIISTKFLENLKDDNYYRNQLSKPIIEQYRLLVAKIQSKKQISKQKMNYYEKCFNVDKRRQIMTQILFFKSNNCRLNEKELIEMYRIYKLYLREDTFIKQFFNDAMNPIYNSLKKYKHTSFYQIFSLFMTNQVLKQQKNILNQWIKDKNFMIKDADIKRVYAMYKQNKSNNHQIVTFIMNYNRSQQKRGVQFTKHFEDISYFIPSQKKKSQNQQELFYNLLQLLEINTASLALSVSQSPTALILKCFSFDRYYRVSLLQILLQKILQLIQKQKKDVYKILVIQIIQEGNFKQQDKDIYLHQVFKLIMFEKNMKPIIKNLLCSNYSQLKYPMKANEEIFKKIICQLVLKIGDGHINYSQFDYLVKNQIKINQILPKSFLFDVNLKAIVDKMQAFNNSYKATIDLLQHFGPTFQKQLKLLQLQKQRFQKEQLCQALVFRHKQLCEIFQEAQSILYIKNSKYWNKKEISSIKQILEEYKRANTNLLQKIQQFQTTQLGLSIFNDNFIKIKGLQYIFDKCTIVSDKLSNRTKNELLNLYKILSEQNLNKLLEIAKIQQFILKTINGKIEQPNSIIQLLNKALKSPQRVNINNLVTQIKDQVERTYSLYQSTENNGNTLLQIQSILSNPVFMIFQKTKKRHSFFTYLTENNINDKITEQLADYIDDLEYSSLRLQNIEQFRRVIKYHNYLDKFSINQLIKRLMKEQSQVNKALSLSQCIENCYSFKNKLKEMIWKVKNKEISFQFELKELLNKSTITMKYDKNQGFFHIQSTFSLGNQNTQVFNIDESQYFVQQKRQQKNINFQQLSLYKEKSMLILKDIKKNKYLSEIKQDNNNTMKIFKTFQKMYSKLDLIYKLSESLYNYGYFPQCLQFQVEVEDYNLFYLEEYCEEITKTSQQWMTFIKKIYSKSYFLTHYIGPSLNQFKQNFIKGHYLPIYKHILGYDKKKYSYLIHNKIKQFINQELIHKNDPIQIITAMTNAIEDQNIQDKSLMKGEINKLLIYVCKPLDVYSCISGGKQIKPNHVLLCQSSTNIEELEFFIYRALIDYHNTYYIVSSHNLREETKLSFIDTYLKLYQQRKQEFLRAKLCFIFYKTNDKIMAFLMKPKLFNYTRKQFTQKQIQTNNTIMLKNNNLLNTYIYQSLLPGLGKSFSIQKQHFLQNNMSKLIRFPVYGFVDFKRLSQRLEQIVDKYDGQDWSLLIQIGFITNSTEFEVFLAQIILFRCFYYQKYIFLPKNLTLFIQFQNLHQNLKGQSYNIIQIFRKFKKITVIEQFKVENLQFDKQNESNDKFILLYLQKIYNKAILSEELSYKYTYLGNQSKYQISLEQSHRLIGQYFYKWFQNKRNRPTYLLYRNFMNILINLFKAFSDSPHFSVQSISQIPIQLKALKFDTVRLQFLLICIKNTLESIQEQNLLQLNNFYHKFNDFKLLIVPTKDFQGFQFVYLDDKTVNLPIKLLLIKSNPALNIKISKKRLQKTQVELLFKQTALNQKGNNILYQLFEKIYHISGNKKFNVEKQRVRYNEQLQRLTYQELKQTISDLKHYKITLDNFFKMCLIILRSICNVPIIIMGESGVGKTALIKFLVQTIFEQKLIVKNVHAGIGQKQITDFVEEMKRETNNLSKQNEKLWVFFDQFNTSDYLSAFKEIVIDRRYMGQKLPNNIIFLAACNPYRQKKQRKINVGLKYQNKNEKQNNLAFKVRPPSLSMGQLMWNYHTLKHEQMRFYVNNMLDEIDFQPKDRLINAIIGVHQDLKKNIDVSIVSLRDVFRFKLLYFWFLQNSLSDDSIQKLKPQNQLKICQDKIIEIHSDKQQLADKKPQNELIINQGEIIERNSDKHLKAIILSFCFCYTLRIEDKGIRRYILQSCEKQLKLQKNIMLKILEYQQMLYIKQLKIKQQQIAFNSTLKQNLFTSFVCLMNKIPILIIGNPGSSKSLSIRMLDSNLKGSNSQSNFCKKFKGVQFLYFQGSECSTSQGVEGMFQRLKQKFKKEQQFIDNYNKDKKQENKKVLDYFVSILFDQIGLAQKSIHNPLKVLHSKLQTHERQAFIGISNFQLDFAKMSRFLTLTHYLPDQQEIRATALELFQTFNIQSPSKKQLRLKFHQLGSYYYKFMEKWNNDRQKRQNFFGLRDFYSYIKYICKQLIRDNKCILPAMQRSIQINFDGQKGSLQLFSSIIKQKQDISQIKYMNPLEIIRLNLNDKTSRCLMLIIKSDYLIPIINNHIQIDRQKRQYICIYGSTFDDDKESQEYNLQITAKIISYLSKPIILIFKDINNSIQTSLYDLFNKSFIRRNKLKTCRIAVGAYSNTKCNVHQDFNSIIVIQQQNLSQLDLSFINRFQKHQLNLKNILDDHGTNDKRILEEIIEWLNIILCQNKTKIKRQSLLINCNQHSLLTLIIKHRQSQSKVMKIKSQILQNRTTDFDILVKCNPKIAEECDLERYLSNIIPYHNNKNDLIIYTYSIFSERNQDKFDEASYYIRIGQLKSQRQFLQNIEKAITKQNKYTSIKIILDYVSEQKHINYLLFSCKQLKKSYETSIQIVLIIQLYRHLMIKEQELIKISYLHDYDQYFVQNLSQSKLEDEEHLLIGSQTFLQLYDKLQLYEKLQYIHIQALKLINFKGQAGQDNNIRQIFHHSSLLIEKECFKKPLQQIVHKKLVNKQANLLQLHTNHEILQYSSNINEALEQYVIIEIKKLIFYLLKKIILKGLTICPSELLDLKPKIFQQFLKNRNGQFMNALQNKYQQFLNQITQSILTSQQQKDQFIHLSSYTSIKIPIYQSIFPCGFEILYKIYNINDNQQQQNNVQVILRGLSMLKNKNQPEQYKNKLSRAKKCLEQVSHKLIYKNLSQLNIDEKSKFQDILFFDVFNYHLFRIGLRVSSEQICQIYTFICDIMEDRQFQSKILLLVFNINFSYYFIDLLNVAIKIIKSSRLSSLIKIQFDELKIKQEDSIEELLIKMAEVVLKNIFDNVQLSKQGISPNVFESVQKYKAFMRISFQKIYSLNKNFKDIDSLQISSSFKSVYNLIELQNNLNNLSKNSHKFMFIESILNQNNDFSLFKKIYRSLKSVLNDDKLIEQKIINYLGLSIFQQWLQNIEQYQDEEQECIQQFIFLCNQYVLFAHSSTYFFSILFQLDDLESYSELRAKIDEYSQNYRIKSEKITLKDNFSIVLGNFFNNFIFEISQKYQVKYQVQSYKKNILEQQMQFVCQILKKESKGLLKVFDIQFLKHYFGMYLQLLQLNCGQLQLLNKIDVILCKNQQICQYLRVYLLKLLLKNHKEIERIKEKYVVIQRCKWILQLKQFLNQEKVEYFKTVQLNYNKSIKQPLLSFKNMLHNLQIQKFQNIALFHDVIFEAFNGIPEIGYELLTFMMFKIYNNSLCSKKNQERLLKEFKQRKDIELNANKILSAMIEGYLTGKLTKHFNYSPEQYKQQIIFLNYINMIFSFRCIQIPFNEMFFDKMGSFPQNYQEWLNQRFLLGSFYNPAVLRLKFILRQHEKAFVASSYTICSNNCDYLAPIGGTFYGNKNEGCAHPTSLAKCPLCTGLLGAKKYNKLAKQQQGARVILPDQIQSQLQRILAKNQVKINYKQSDITLKLKGYSKEIDEKSIKQSIQLKNHIKQLSCDHLEQEGSMISHLFIKFLTNLTWYFLAETKILNVQHHQNIWGKNPFQIQKEFKLFYQLYYSQIKKSLKLEDQNFTVWNIGMVKVYYDLMQDYSKKKLNFRLQIHEQRNSFQQYFQDYCSKYYDKNKQKLILKSRKLQKQNKSDVIRQIGNLRSHQAQFQYIKMYMNVKQKPSCANLEANYQNLLKTKYNILAYLIYNPQIAEKIAHYKIIFSYVTHLHQFFNKKIKRFESKQPVLQMLKQYGELSQNFMKFSQFLTSWNYLSKSKFKLQMDCHSEKILGELPEINQSSQLRMFLIDKHTINNENAERLLAFIRIAAEDYNQICKILEGMFINSYPYLKSSPIFSEIKLNPTMLSDSQAKLMAQFPQKRLDRIIEILSSQSIEYGISTCYYPFDEIQRHIIRQFLGCRYAEISKQRYNYIEYVGEKTHFIMQLRQQQEQITLQKLKMKQLIEKYLDKIVSATKNYKKLKDIQILLQSLISHYKSMKKQQKTRAIQMNLLQFIQSQQISHISLQILEEPLNKVTINALVDLYELIEYFTYENIDLNLEVSYQKELEKEQLQRLYSLIDKVKKSNSQTLPSYKQLKFAMYKLAGRTAILMINNENQKLADHLCQLSEYWPKQMNSLKINNELRQLLNSFNLCHIGSILKEMPFKDKDSKSEEVNVNPKSRQQQIIKPKNPPKKIKNKKDL